MTNLSHPQYRPDIDGLRAIGVLAVVLFHAFPNSIKGGFIGVDVFFVISGYLISTIIFANLDRGTFSFSEFYARRIKRIFPALILVLVVCFTFGWFTLLAEEYKQLGKHIAAGAGFVSNFYFLREAGYFDNAADTKPLIHLWSLGIEEQFYIVWPLLLWVAWKRKFNFLTLTIIVATASFALNVKGVKQNAIATFYSPQTRFWELLSGSLLAWVTLYKKAAFDNITNKIDCYITFILFREKEIACRKITSNALSFFGVLLLAYGFWRINKNLSFPGMWALIPVLGAVLILSADPKAFFNRTVLSNKIAVWFGLISFPLYLWHWPLLIFARFAEGGGIPNCNIRFAIVGLSIALAWLTYKIIEGPIRLGSHNKLKTVMLLFIMTLIGVLGYITFERNGLQFRLINQLNKGVNQALSYDSNTGFRSGVCFIDDINEKTNKFSNICGESKVKNLSSLFIWGDSHSASLYRGFEYYAKAKNYSLYQFSASGCPPILDFFVSKRKECINSNKFVYEEIKRLKPDTLILAAYWSMYDGTDGWENLDTDKLVTTISKLQSRGIKNIVLIGHLPAFTLNQADLLRRRTIWDQIDTRTYNKFKPTVKIFDKKIRDLAVVTGVKFISPLDILCDSNGCLLSIPGNNVLPLSFDYGHLTTNGSIFLVTRFFESDQIKFIN